MKASEGGGKEGSEGEGHSFRKWEVLAPEFVGPSGLGGAVGSSVSVLSVGARWCRGVVDGGVKERGVGGEVIVVADVRSVSEAAFLLLQLEAEARLPDDSGDAVAKPVVPDGAVSRAGVRV